jgi:glycosyltransferase involved in cell wall biosynthesis
VIASRLAGIPEEVADEKTGLLFEPGNAAQLAAAISRLLESAELRREMGREGRRRFLERFEAGIVCGRYGELYQGVIAATRRLI